MGVDLFATNLQNICRACLCEGLTNNEMDVRPNNQLNALNTTYTHPNGKVPTQTEPLLKLLLSIVPELNCFESDDLPNSLCCLCVNKLLEAYDFQQMCLRAERQLREWLSTQTSVKLNNKCNNSTDENKEKIEDQLNNDKNKTIKDHVEAKITEVNESAEEITDASNLFKNDIEALPIIPNQNDNIYKEEDLLKCSTIAKRNCEYDSKKFVCKDCGHKLKTQKSLHRHQQNHQRLPEQIKKIANDRKNFHQCQFCDKAFQQSSTLKDHLRVHTGEQPFLCSECGKAFKSSSNMKQHLLRHSGDKRYECPECPKRFRCVSDLSSHKAVHNKIKSHACDVCGSAFTKPYQLKKHKMYHSGERPHKCEHCDMRFVLAHQMRRHLRTHTGEKPYKCKYCPRAFAQSNDLVKHLRNHLGDNIYKCELCPKAFRLIKDLRVHFTIHKNKDVN